MNGSHCCKQTCLEFDDDMKNVITVIRSIFSSALRHERHRLKMRYFAGRTPSDIPTTSPILQMTDDQWCDLVEYWSTQKNLVCSVKTVRRDHITDSYLSMRLTSLLL